MSTPHPARRRLDRDTIVAEAIRLARSAGIEAVTMRRLGEELGTAAMSLYRHVADRRELLIAMLDAVAQGVHLPAPVVDPRAEITVVLTAIHDALRRDPWAIHLIVTDKLAGPSILPAVERIFAALSAAGLKPRDCRAAYALLWHYTVGELIDTHHTDPDDYSRRMVRAADPDTYPALSAVTDAFPAGPPGDWFPENLQHLLDGLLSARR